MAESHLVGLDPEKVKALIYRHVRPPGPDECVRVTGWTFDEHGTALVVGRVDYGPREIGGAELIVREVWFNYLEPTKEEP